MLKSIFWTGIINKMIEDDALRQSCKQAAKWME
jgi:hypothetical protein